MTWPNPTDVGDVYAPAEDSDLLATAAVETVDPGELVLDVGTGSGYVAGRVAETGARVVATDLNPHAVRQTRERYGVGADGRRDTGDEGTEDRDDDRRRGVDGLGTVPARPVTVVRGDLVGPFGNDVFDLVTFNPPYLPTDPDDERDDWMARALSGGPDGRAVIDRFLDDVGRVLSSDGVCLLLVSTLTGVDEVAERAGAAGFSVAVVEEAAFPFETLSVLKLFGHGVG